MSQTLLGCGALNARLLIGEDALFGGISYCLCGDFRQLSVAGETVYVTAKDRAAAAASKRKGKKAKTSNGTASKTASSTWTLTELENEGEAVWQALNASVTLIESKRAVCDDLKHVLEALRTGQFDARSKRLIREATQATITAKPSIMMCDRNDSVNQINYISAHIYSNGRTIYRCDNGVNKAKGVHVPPPQGISQLYHLGGKPKQGDGPLVNLDLCVGDKVAVYYGNDHLDDKGFGQGAIGTFVGLWPDPAGIDHTTQQIILPNGVPSQVWLPNDVSDIRFCLIHIPTQGNTKFRCAGFDHGIYPCPRPSQVKKLNKELLTVNGFSYRADQFLLRRLNAKTVHKSQGETAKTGPVVISIMPIPSKISSTDTAQLYYVAISRASTWSQIVLLSTITEQIMALCGESKRLKLELAHQHALQTRLLLIFQTSAN
jgi:hypothetical protein